MTEWKAGDFAMIEIQFVDGSHVFVQGYACASFPIPKSQLHPLPPAMTEAEKALVEAAISWRTDQLVDGTKSLMAAADAVLAERAPPDPAEVAWKFANNAPGEMIGGVPEWFRATLKAYDAANGPVPTFAEVEALRTSCLSAGESVRIWADRTLKVVAELKTAEAEIEALQAELTVANVKLKMLRSEVTNLTP